MHFFVDKKIRCGSISPARLATIGSDPERLKLKSLSSRSHRRFARGVDENVKLRCDGRIPKGVRTPESSDFGDRKLARVSNIDAEGLKIETQITRDRYFCDCNNLRRQTGLRFVDWSLLPQHQSQAPSSWKLPLAANFAINFR